MRQEGTGSVVAERRNHQDERLRKIFDRGEEEGKTLAERDRERATRISTWSF